eukprot:CAMPEP_0175079372 /NCGR_PEP_ID=MMETSP0052_2-20121109/24778_1 /TAXON_ID=51329 ORGANISM="Polytomella parva, Strain SAG 63-3" /NCGR_SAMPLE_ID=MMETSP0052_2 /ASSEMBLY_ACC=CAM_ASM_000194 /LENGTH=137 /DNA_ID=CAMNT_0016349679 /DNA_START=36 /DNA_END=446 /DNA_ORIENTATION=-
MERSAAQKFLPLAKFISNFRNKNGKNPSDEDISPQFVTLYHEFKDYQARLKSTRESIPLTSTVPSKEIEPLTQPSPPTKDTGTNTLVKERVDLGVTFEGKSQHHTNDRIAKNDDVDNDNIDDDDINKEDNDNEDNEN